MSKARRYEDVLAEDHKDPVEAAGYLNACLEDGDPEVFLLALCDVARAQAEWRSSPRSPNCTVSTSTGCSPKMGTPSSVASERSYFYIKE
jgi:hypothetical protein